MDSLYPEIVIGVGYVLDGLGGKNIFWDGSRALFRRSSEAKWVDLYGKMVPIFPYCKNPLTKQPLRD